MDNRAGTIRTEPAPPNARTKHLGHSDEKALWQNRLNLSSRFRRLGGNRRWFGFLLRAELSHVVPHVCPTCVCIDIALLLTLDRRAVSSNVYGQGLGRQLGHDRIYR